MTLGIYKVAYEPTDYPGPLEDEEVDFLKDMAVEDLLGSICMTVRVDKEGLDRLLEAWRELEPELLPPKGLVEWLKKQVADGSQKEFVVRRP